jgi:Icc-related predicted phosphoesterase
MKIIAISDTHGQHEKLTIPAGDLIIHSGDFSSTGNQMDHILFSKWFGSLPHKHKICVPGNHDRYSQDQTNLTKEMFKSNGVTLLIDEEITIEGLKIYGSPWTPRFGRWYWMKNRGNDIKLMWENIPDNLDILITHGPVNGILDFVEFDNIHVGCEELEKTVELRKPKNHIFGHIHEWGGNNIKRYNTTFYNASICNEDYYPLNKITEFEI